MKLVFGLGNPEKEYTGTRHNIGKEVVNNVVCNLLNDNFFDLSKAIKKFLGSNICGNWENNRKLNSEILKYKLDSGGKVMFVKPLRYMNDSGIVVRDVVSFYKVKLEDVLVIYDDLDLVVGEFKLKQGGATKVHNGINSIFELVGEKSFKKMSYLKIGVREKHIPMSVKSFGLHPNKYVLGKLPKEDKELMKKRMKSDVVPAVLAWLSK